MELTITENDHLLIVNDSVVLESIFLPMCGGPDVVVGAVPFGAIRKLNKVLVTLKNPNSDKNRVFRIIVSFHT